eukprot:403356672
MKDQIQPLNGSSLQQEQFNQNNKSLKQKYLNNSRQNDLNNIDQQHQWHQQKLVTKNSPNLYQSNGWNQNVKGLGHHDLNNKSEIILPQNIIDINQGKVIFHNHELDLKQQVSQNSSENSLIQHINGDYSENAYTLRIPPKPPLQSKQRDIKKTISTNVSQLASPNTSQKPKINSQTQDSLFPRKQSVQSKLFDMTQNQKQKQNTRQSNSNYDIIQTKNTNSTLKDQKSPTSQIEKLRNFNNVGSNKFFDYTNTQRFSVQSSLNFSNTLNLFQGQKQIAGKKHSTQLLNCNFGDQDFVQNPVETIIETQDTQVNDDNQKQYTNTTECNYLSPQDDKEVKVKPKIFDSRKPKQSSAKKQEMIYQNYLDMETDENLLNLHRCNMDSETTLTFQYSKDSIPRRMDNMPQRIQQTENELQDLETLRTQERTIKSNIAFNRPPLQQTSNSVLNHANLKELNFMRNKGVRSPQPIMFQNKGLCTRLTQLSMNEPSTMIQLSRNQHVIIQRTNESKSTLQNHESTLCNTFTNTQKSSNVNNIVRSSMLRNSKEGSIQKQQQNQVIKEAFRDSVDRAKIYDQERRQTLKTQPKHSKSGSKENSIQAMNRFDSEQRKKERRIRCSYVSNKSQSQDRSPSIDSNELNHRKTYKYNQNVIKKAVSPNPMNKSLISNKSIRSQSKDSSNKSLNYTTEVNASKVDKQVNFQGKNKDQAQKNQESKKLKEIQIELNMLLNKKRNSIQTESITNQLIESVKTRKMQRELHKKQILNKNLNINEKGLIEDKVNYTNHYMNDPRQSYLYDQDIQQQNCHSDGLYLNKDLIDTGICDSINIQLDNQ